MCIRDRICTIHMFPNSGKIWKFCMKYGHLILRKIFKFVATRWQVLRLKCTKFNFSWGSAPDHAGGAYSALPDLILLSEERGRGTEGEVGEEEEREVEGTTKVGSRPNVRNHENYRLHNSLMWLVGAAIQTFAPGGKYPHAATGYTPVMNVQQFAILHEMSSCICTQDECRFIRHAVTALAVSLSLY